METLPNIPSPPREIDFQLDNSNITTQCDPFDFDNPIIDPIVLSNSLTLTREKHNGIGLAANQVGLLTRVISVKGIDTALFNPRIVSDSKDGQLEEEGCLSFPGLSVKVRRPTTIRVRYTDALGQTQTNAYNGLTARIIQHEIDHLEGILFYNRAHKFHRDQGFRKWKRQH